MEFKRVVTFLLLVISVSCRAQVDSSGYGRFQEQQGSKDNVVVVRNWPYVNQGDWNRDSTILVCKEGFVLVFHGQAAHCTPIQRRPQTHPHTLHSLPDNIVFVRKWSYVYQGDLTKDSTNLVCNEGFVLVFNGQFALCMPVQRRPQTHPHTIHTLPGMTGNHMTWFKEVVNRGNVTWNSNSTYLISGSSVPFGGHSAPEASCRDGYRYDTSYQPPRCVPSLNRSNQNRPTSSIRRQRPGQQQSGEGALELNRVSDDQ